MDFAVGGLASAIAGFFSNPIDVLKTRMQLQGELKARGQHRVHYRNVFHAAKVVVRNDGWLALQKGLLPAVSVHFVRNSVRLGIYQWMIDNQIVVDAKGKTIFWKSFTGGALAGAAGAFLGSPLFMIKTQLQSQADRKIAVGFQHSHSSTTQALKFVFQQHGVKGLWRGSTAVVLRALMGSSSQLSFFAITKDFLNNNNMFDGTSPILKSLVASMVGGVFQTVTMNPFDLVSIRLYNQGVDAQGRGLLYHSIPDCFYKVWKTEGFLGFFKGITANYMRLAPHGALTLVLWDVLKNIIQNK